ncbi:PHP domain-containing protein [Flaviflexus massiliensis]|uniref:PHP domain-containing protein n=1 Tax=Flaviflexus massiliensis TaxID=1522309 RepID=UPI0006D56C4D|nr:PHP domain-containing protein [Flaviflexus massiliensis]
MIDLHTHSAYSDGTQTPLELMTEAAQVGITVLGLTDHDTIAGYEDAKAAAEATGVGLVTGIEISTRFKGRVVHLLGYLFDHTRAIAEHCTRVRKARVERLRDMVDVMERDGLITWEEVQQVAGTDATLGRPHIADALLQRGTITHRDEAFTTYLSPSSPYYRSYWAPTLQESIKLIHDAGGVAVWAHPRAAARGGMHDWQAIREGIALGIDGLEVDHRDNPVADRAKLASMVSELGLVRTGSSDYHGSGKHNQLGEHNTSPHMLERIAHQATMEVYRP